MEIKSEAEALEIVWDGSMLKFIPQELRTEAVCIRAVERAGRALSEVPREMKTRAICLAAVQQCGSALKYVPDGMKDREICLAAVRDDAVHAMPQVPESMATPELCVAAVRRDIRALALLPGMPPKGPGERYPSSATAESRLKLKRLLKIVPDRFMTEDLCEAIADQCGLALEWMPERLKTEKVCLAAVCQEGAALMHVPLALRTPKICKAAVRQNSWAVKYVPEDVLTEKMCNIAMRGKRNLEHFLPAGFRKEHQPVYRTVRGPVNIDALCKEWQSQKERIGEYSSLDLQDIARTGTAVEKKEVKKKKKKKRRT